MGNVKVVGRDESLALSPREAARALGISPRTLWEHTKRGTIPHVRLGRRILYPTQELREWLGGRRGTGTTI